MASYGEPDWATPGATSTATITTTENAATGGGISAPPRVNYETRDNSKSLIVLLSLLDFILSGMMMALGILTLIHVFTNFSAKQWPTALLAVYMVIFAMLIFVYEWMWWAAVPAVNRTLRRNFGFLYGIRGKGFYLIFVAFLCLGLGKQHFRTVEILNPATGISFLVVGVTHITLSCIHPSIVLEYKPPSAGFLGNGDTTTQQPLQNPV